MLSVISTKPFRALRITGLVADRCRVVEGSLVRIYFRLSSPPPVGWSYIFSTIWQDTDYPMKRAAAVDGDSVWVECLAEEIEPYHRHSLEDALVRTNAIYWERLCERRRHEWTRSAVEARFRSQIEELSLTLYPEEEVAPPEDIPQSKWRGHVLSRIVGLVRQTLGRSLTPKRDQNVGTDDNSDSGFHAAGAAQPEDFPGTVASEEYPEATISSAG